jgi:hypothetical protein
MVALIRASNYFITTNGQLQVARCDTLHLEILAGVARQLKNFRCQVFQYSRCVRRPPSLRLVGSVARIVQETVDTTDWEL